MEPEDWIVPDWPAPENVKALITTRAGGVSTGKYASLNLGDHVGDDSACVARNRTLLKSHLPSDPKWLKQVHGSRVVLADGALYPKEGDGAIARKPGTVCAVLVADCLPVLLCGDTGTVVGVAHAGWRGLAAGVLEETVKAMGLPGKNLMAFLGPAIGPDSFEVGDEVRQVFLDHDKKAAFAFMPRDNGKWLADLSLLARQRLAEKEVRRVYGGDWDTFSEPARFFSYRRDGSTGRMAALIWMA